MIRKKEVLEACGEAARNRFARKQKFGNPEHGWFEDVDIQNALPTKEDGSQVSYQAIQRHLNNLVQDGILVKKGRGLNQSDNAIKIYRVLTPVEIAKKRCGHEEP
jgi:hypothetical protein